MSHIKRIIFTIFGGFIYNNSIIAFGNNKISIYFMYYIGQGTHDGYFMKRSKNVLFRRLADKFLMVEELQTVAPEVNEPENLIDAESENVEKQDREE